MRRTATNRKHLSSTRSRGIPRGRKTRRELPALRKWPDDFRHQPLELEENRGRGEPRIAAHGRPEGRNQMKTHRPLRRKLRYVILTTCAVSLLVACAVLFAVQFYFFR